MAAKKKISMIHVCLSHAGIVSKWQYGTTCFLRYGLPWLMLHCACRRSAWKLRNLQK